jgi:predicted glycoside hydrolase/deacetylase ChbG (UPF0249 family)
MKLLGLALLMNGAKRIACLLAVSIGCARASEVKPMPASHEVDRPANARWLVIHADDFGMSHSVNRATMQAFENHWITSASILVPCPWFPEAAKFAREHPEADLGIHLALNSEWTSLRWGPVAPRDRVPSLLDADGYFPLVETQVVEKARAPEVETELVAQIDRARSLGVNVTHFDAHMGTLLRSPDLFGTLLKVSETYRMPIRLAEVPDFARANRQAPVWLDRILDVGASVPPDQWLSHYESMLSSLPPGHLPADGASRVRRRRDARRDVRSPQLGRRVAPARSRCGSEPRVCAVSTRAGVHAGQLARSRPATPTRRRTELTQT